MTSELIKKVEQRKKQKALEQFKSVRHCSPFNSKEILEAYLPKTKTQNWYIENCMGINNIPMKAVNGHNGGTPFYTKDKKIMRSGDSTWFDLKIGRCQ